ncbi:MAG TPA: 4Fe-4S dicluster domain-containing protein [Anaerolineae bacterium]|nr:4Fe-4S dicluster domain-containing protein [Anaerolineae bacterium]
MCLPACNYEALIWVRSDEMLLIDPWACNGCGKCITTCPKGALELQPRPER